MKPSRVTQLMLTNGFGGAERHFVDLSLSLADRGVRIQAICHPKFPHRQALAAHAGIEVFPVRCLGGWDRWAGWNIRRAIAAFAPDLVHTHLARGSYFGGRAAAMLGLPSVANLHNYIDLKYYRDINAFIAATEDQHRYLLAQGISEKAITTMPHFSLLPPIAPVALPEDRPLRFIALGRLVKKKGFDVLIAAFQEYLRAGFDGQLILGGDGPEREALATLAEAPELVGKIEFSGWIDDIGSFLARGDVFVLPSLDEPFGIVVLEAMASGRPIITTRTQGPITILDDSSAYFSDIGDVLTLTRAMCTVASDKPAAACKAEVATALYCAKFSAGAVVPQVEAVYRGLLEASKPSSASVAST